MTTTSTTTDSGTIPDRRHATWAHLAASYVVGVVALGIQSLAYHLHGGGNGFGTDLVFYVVSGLVGVVLAALAIALARRTGRPAVCGLVAAVVGLLLFPVGYYMPVTVILGLTAYLLSRTPGLPARPPRPGCLGALAVLCQVAVVVYRIAGGMYQVGG